MGSKTRKSAHLKKIPELDSDRRRNRCRENDREVYSDLSDEIEEKFKNIEIEDNANMHITSTRDESASTGKHTTPVKNATMKQKAIHEQMENTGNKVTKVLSIILKREKIIDKNGITDQWRSKLRKSSRQSCTPCTKVMSDSDSVEESVSEDSEYVPLGDDDDGDNDDSDDGNDDDDDDASSTDDKDDSSNTDDNDAASNVDDNDDDDAGNADDDDKNKEISKDIPVSNVVSVQKSQPPIKGIQTRSKSHRKLHTQSENYFIIQSEKCHTSNNTLGKLKHRMDEKTMHALLSDEHYISDKHKEGMKILSESNEEDFEKWLYFMEEGFNVLLYGLGSKWHLINNFHKKKIIDFPTLVVNGFFPSLTIKDILDGIIVDILEKSSIPNQNECFEVIKETMISNPDDRLYILIHNIDGAMLRSKKAQDVLSRLAEIPNIHLLASVDHINAPLLWDNVKRSRYNFYFHEATTLLPYKRETSYEDSMLINQSGALALSSLRNVFLSLTPNARDIYIILVKFQLENGGGNNYSGMSFRKLYHACRDRFIATAELALRAHLGEFVDHKLIKKRNVDGVEHLVIPLESVLLKQFLEFQEP